MQLQRTPLAVVVLNACPQPALRETQARILSEVGYYPASAGTAENASCLVASVVCSVAIMGHTFKRYERRLIQRRIEDALRATRVMQLTGLRGSLRHWDEKATR